MDPEGWLLAENFKRLSPRELTIAERFAGGETYTQIAQALHIAPSTVRNHLAAIYRKLEVNSKPTLIGALAAIRESAEHPPGHRVDTKAENVSKGAIGLVDQAPVRYCRSVDGVSVAHAQVGTGYPLVFGGSWMTHLEKDWENPGYGHYLSHLAENFTIIRYDQRATACPIGLTSTSPFRRWPMI